MVPNGWEYTTLESLCDKDSPITYGVLKPGKYCEGGTPLLQIKDLLSNLNNVENIHKIPAELDFEYRRSKIKTNDILISLVGTVGRIGIVPSTLDNANIHRNLGRIRTKCFEYLVHYLNSDIAKNRIGLSSSGSSQSALNLSVLRSLKVPIPPLPEQQKIAKILSTWDKAIVTTEKLIATSKQQKKALMQQLFTGKKRFLDPETGKPFEGEWEEVQLDEISDITTGSSNREDSSLDGEFTFFDRSEDIRTSSRYLFDSEAVIVAGEGQDFVPKYFKGKFDLHQRTYAIINIENAIGKFLYFYIGYNRHYFLAQAVGSTVKSLRLPMFKKMPIILPCLEEQQRIASVLTAADKEIELLESKLTHFNQEKRA